MKVSELKEKAGLTLVNTLYDKEIEGVYISDMVSDIIAAAPANCLLLTIQTHKNLIATANLADVAAIVFVRDKKPLEDVIELSERAKISLFTTELDSWNLAIKLHELGIA
jgi:hypothetical protein